MEVTASFFIARQYISCSPKDKSIEIWGINKFYFLQVCYFKEKEVYNIEDTLEYGSKQTNDIIRLFLRRRKQR